MGIRLKTRRTLAIALALLLLTTALGALAVQAMSQDAPRRPNVPQTESGALQHQAVADAAAAAWRDDATLVRIAASEGPLVDGHEDPPFRWDTSGDPIVGNGAALVWTFAYASPDAPRVSFWASVGGDGELLYARELTDPFWCCVSYASVGWDGHTEAYEEPARPIQPVSASIDAPAAVSTVLDRPEFANFSLDHPVFETNVMLHPYHENRSAWMVIYRTATHYVATATIDAESGEVLHVGAWPDASCCEHVYPMPPEPPIGDPVPPEPCCRPEDYHATYSGDVEGWGYEVGFPVEQAAWLDALRVQAQVESAAHGQETFRLSILDGSGREIARTTSATGLLELTLDSAPIAGAYVARVQRDGGSAMLHMPPATETPVTLSVDVTYADAPRERPLQWTFLGEAWPTGETWTDLWIEGEEWRPMRPTQLVLSWESVLPGEALRVSIRDSWGNEIARAQGDAATVGAQQVALDIPHVADECCLTAVVEAPLGATRVVPYALDLHVEPAADVEHAFR